MLKVILVILNVILVIMNFGLYMMNPEKNVFNLVIAGLWFVAFLLNLFSLYLKSKGKDKED